MDAILPLLPHLNVVLNATAGVLLVCGFIAVRRLRIETHKRFMLSAFACSAAFLVSYVIHKVGSGTVKFPEEYPTARIVYLCILVPHFLLAMLVVPLAITTIVLGLRNKVATHRKFARLTLPIWLFVSVTGIVVYLMLYQIYSVR